MNIAIVLSGGVGRRLKAAIPKQYIEVQGKMIITRCLERVLESRLVDALQIVASDEWRGKISEEMEKLNIGGDIGYGGKFRGFSEPGENRQLSILNALEDIEKYAEPESVVLVHDAARPLVSARQIDECIEAALGCDGAMPTLAMKDTVYISRDGKRVSSLIDRSSIFAGQAPEAFRLGKYLSANRALLPERIKSINGSTEPAIMSGMDIAMIDGDEDNFKITTDADLRRYIKLLSEGDV